MVQFSSALLRREVLLLGDAYGGPRFWYELLREDNNPDNVWRALLYIGCVAVPGPEPVIRNKLLHPESRVRAMACFALGCFRDQAAVERLRQLCGDPSARVRIHARAALAGIVDDKDLPPVTLRPGGGEGVTILISEDSSIQQDEIAAALQPLGQNVACASEAAETLEMARRLRPRLVVTDNQKGRDNTSGLRVTEAISRDPDLKEAVLLMLLADPLDGTFLWHGGDRFVHKRPGGLRELRTVAGLYLQ